MRLRSGGASSRGPPRTWRRPWFGAPKPPRSLTACSAPSALPGSTPCSSVVARRVGASPGRARPWQAPPP
eukprot:4773619-Alexandrium_andersonii.AAC.1